MPELTILDSSGKESTITVPKGSNLRNALLEHGFSPYTKITSQLNCGGNGICATCGVFILDKEIMPTHWHDKLAKKFRYPRLSCQIKILEDLTIEIPKKLIWGKRSEL